MRDLPSDVLAALISPQRAHYYRILLEDPDGNMGDVSSILGLDWLTGISGPSGDIDQLARTLNVRLRRAFGHPEQNLSMAPLMEGSLVNRDDEDFYAPRADHSRLLEFWAAILPEPGVPDEPDFHLLFEGRTKGWGAAPSMELRALDRYGDLLAVKIETEQSYGSEAGVPIETLAQQLLDANLSSGLVTVIAPVSPGAMITRFVPEIGISVGDALAKLIDDIGWTIRYRWSDAENDLVLLLYQIDPDDMTPVFTFPAGSYFRIHRYDVDTSDVVNRIGGSFVDPSGQRVTMTPIEDADSIEDLGGDPIGVRYAEIHEPEGSQIDSEAEWNAMAAAALAALSRPLAEVEWETLWMPFLDEGDVISLEADGVVTDQDQTIAVVTTQPEVSHGKERSIIIGRSRPAGAYYRWRKRTKPPEPPRVITPPSVIAVPIQDGPLGRVELQITDPSGVAKISAFELYEGEGDWEPLPDPADWTYVDATLPLDTVSPNVALHEKHNSAIAWGVAWDDENGVTHWITGVETLDIDLVAKIRNATISFGPTGLVVVNGEGDEDTVDWFGTIGIGSAPADPTTGAFDVFNATRMGTVTSAIQAAPNSDVYLKIRGRNATGDLGPVLLIRRRRTDGRIKPLVSIEKDQVGSTGLLDITILDPTLAITSAPEFQLKEGAGDFSGSWLTTWDRSTGTAGTNEVLTRGEDIDLAAKHAVAIKVRFNYLDENGAARTFEIVVEFDADNIAELDSLTIGFTEDGYVVLSWSGDEDFVQGYVNVGLDKSHAGAEPADPTAGSKHATLAGRVGTIILDGTGGTTARIAAMGQTCWVKAIAENDLGDITLIPGTAFVRVWEKIRIRGDAQFIPPRVRTEATRSGDDVTVVHTIDDPSLAIIDIGYKTRLPPGAMDAGWSTASWGGSSTGTIGTNTALMRTKTITSPKGLDGDYIYRIRYQDELGGTQEKGGHIKLDNLDEVSKEMEIPSSMFVGVWVNEPTLSQTTVTVRGSNTLTGGVDEDSVFYAPVILPKSAEIEGMSARVTRNSTAHLLDLALFRGNETLGSAPTSLGSVTLPVGSGSTGDQTLTTTFAETVGDFQYYLSLITNNDSGPGGAAALGRVRISYLAPSYEVTL